MHLLESWRRAAATCLAAVALTCCSALPTPELKPFLDEKTGISLTVVDQPLILARERRDIAAHARDYLTLVAAERDEMGRRQLVLIAHRWSTIDQRVGASADAEDQQLVLIADGRDFRLSPLAAQLPAEFSQADQLWRPSVSEVRSVAYRVDATLLGQLADSRSISAVPGYTIWEDGRAALRRLLDATGAAR